MTDVRIDHVGIAVESVADLEPVLELLGCEKLIARDDDEQGFRWVYYAVGGASRLELVEPLAGRESFLTQFLDRYGPGLHHVTLEVGDLDALIETLEGGGVSVIDRAEREHYAEAFVSPRDAAGVLFQLMEYRESYAEAGSRLYVDGERLSDRAGSRRTS